MVVIDRLSSEYRVFVGDLGAALHGLFALRSCCVGVSDCVIDYWNLLGCLGVESTRDVLVLGRNFWTKVLAIDHFIR